MTVEEFAIGDNVEILSEDIYYGHVGKIWAKCQNDFDSYMVDIRPHCNRPVRVEAKYLRHA
jgi:hypothetical protein